MSTCLVTGAGGFIGRHTVATLIENGHHVRAAIRRSCQFLENVEQRVISDIGQGYDWSELVAGVDAVVHLAAKVHVMNQIGAEHTNSYERINVAATRDLALAAARAGVRRFVFISTVKVLGEKSNGHVFKASDAPDPQDEYARSKWAAEQVLEEISADEGMPTTVVRPPLVYGPGVGANFARLLCLVAKGVPLPLAGIRNSRSMISVWNLCDFLVSALNHPATGWRSYLVSDGVDVSTETLIRMIGSALGRPPRLFRFPQTLTNALAAMTGHKAEWRRLCESLRVDISAARADLGWTPPVPIEEGIRRTVGWFQQVRH